MKVTDSKLTILKSPWYRKLCANGNRPHFQQAIADGARMAKTHVSATLNGNIISKTFQERISDEVGIPVGILFGEFAWFRAAARKLKEREAEQLAAC